MTPTVIVPPCITPVWTPTSRCPGTVVARDQRLIVMPPAIARTPPHFVGRETMTSGAATSPPKSEHILSPPDPRPPMCQLASQGTICAKAAEGGEGTSSVRAAPQIERTGGCLEWRAEA